MNFTKKLVILLAVLPFFAGCASTKSKSSAPDDSVEGQIEVETKASTSSLMDLYISGEIPGYLE